MTVRELSQDRYSRDTNYYLLLHEEDYKTANDIHEKDLIVEYLETLDY